MFLLIDNYDSFTYNLVHYLSELGAEIVVVRNDAMSVAEVLAMRPQGIIISPGPGTPAQSGITVPIVQAAAGLPLLGVCLGHQAIGEAFGGRSSGHLARSMGRSARSTTAATACSGNCPTRSMPHAIIR